MKKVAIIYDFDKTLCAKDMQEYSLIPSLGYEKSEDFWKEVTAFSKSNQADSISSYLYILQKKFQDLGKPLKKSDFQNLGEKIDLYPGVKTWFQRINAFGKECGFEIEHYIISSGMQEILEGTEISNEFKKIYACRYYYDENGIAVWPAVVVNYTTKTQYLFRINKQVLDENDDTNLNTWVPFEKRAIPFHRMIYIADGMTDVPCMRLVKNYGGKSIVVYNPQVERTKEIAEKLVREGRAHYITEANYEENGKTETLVKEILSYMQHASILEDREGLTNEEK